MFLTLNGRITNYVICRFYGTCCDHNVTFAVMSVIPTEPWEGLV